MHYFLVQFTVLALRKCFYYFDDWCNGYLLGVCGCVCSLVPDLNCMVSYGTYTSNTHRIKSGDDCDELDADWMTACQLFLEIYDTHNYRTLK